VTLHTIGPETPIDDERVIGRAYQTWLTPLLVAVPVVTAQFADIKWVVATSSAVVIALLHEAGGRLHDLCIRARRANVLLRQMQGDQD